MYLCDTKGYAHCYPFAKFRKTVPSFREILQTTDEIDKIRWRSTIIIVTVRIPPYQKEVCCTINTVLYHRRIKCTGV